MRLKEGRYSLKSERRVLSELAKGPQHITDLRRALGYDVLTVNRTLDALLQRLREAGFIEANRGLRKWQLASGLELCPLCRGAGVRKTEEGDHAATGD